MSRSINEADMGAAPPVVSVIPTFDANFGEANWRERMPGEGFPWNYEFREGVADPAAGEIAVEMPATSGGWASAKMIPVYPPTKLSINNESQYYVNNFQLDDVSPAIEDPLTVLGDGSLRMRAYRTPAQFADTAITTMDAYSITAVDQGAGTVTVKGRSYEVKEPTIISSRYDMVGGPYANTYFTGVNRFMRDDLTGDTVHWAHKREAHAYGLIRIKGANLSGVTGGFTIPGTTDRLFKYDQIDDNITATGGAAVGDDPVGKTADTRHRIHLVPGEISAGWISADPNTSTYGLTMIRRQPYVSAVRTTQGAFSQKFGVWETWVDLDDHKRQFWACFLWGNYLRVQGKSGFKDVDYGDRESNATEIDVMEAPGAGAGAAGRYRRFHNIHGAQPQTANRVSMLNHAESSGRTPVMPSHLPEWDEAYKQQHQIVNQPGDPHWLDYTEKMGIRLYWWAPGNPYGKPGNSVEWYVCGTDEQWFFTGGALSPTWTDDGYMDAKQIFLNNAVWSDFNRSMQHRYNTSGGSANDGDTIDDIVYSLRCYQFVGQTAGGAGFPDENGKYSRGFLPTPFDTTGGSGTGVVSSSNAGTLENDGTVSGWTVPDPGTPPAPTASPASASGYRPDPDNIGIRYRPGLIEGTVVYSLEQPVAGVWDFSDYGADAQAIGPTDASELVLEVNPVVADTIRIVRFIPS